ncbi:hypothetical protein KAZ82_01680 [Candidatus Babeliales bacterium]|nr:hypothetical protein [Candidatus Babeliales bacterium]
MKTGLPYACKVLLLHEKLGKVWCIFDTKHQAVLLHTGSLIFCRLELFKNTYRFIDIEIESMLESKYVPFVHSIMKICIKAVQENVAAPELFDFLRYVFSHMQDLTEQGRTVVLLRIFLMCDYWNYDALSYQIAISDPALAEHYDQQKLNNILQGCWELFMKKNS